MTAGAQVSRGRWALVALTGSAMLVAPAAEVLATGALRERLATCADPPCGGVEAMDIDAGGMQLRGVWREHGAWRLGTQNVEVRPGRRGLEVHVDGLVLERRPRASPASPHPADAPAREAQALAEVSGPAQLDTHGVAVRVAAFGDVVVDVGAARLAIRDPVVQVDPGGRVTANVAARIEHPRANVETHGRIVATPLAGWRTWELAGAVRIDGSEPLALHATASRDSARAQLRTADDRSLDLTVTAAAALTISANASDWPLELVAVPDELVGVEWSGGLELRREADRWDLDVVDSELAGLVIDDPRVAREPVDFGPLSLSGNLWVDSVSRGGELIVGHGGAQVLVAGRDDGQRFDVQVELPLVPCQDLLDALPLGLAPVVAGTRLRGEIEGRFAMSVTRSALAKVKAADPDAEDPPPAPGTMELEFPFLDRCDVVADAAGIDFKALRGPYRHRFVDDAGQPRHKTMAPGAPGYVSLNTVPRLARAFITLEDSRYWQHDGFDRQQIANAWWHNLAQGAIRRGASTITQQAARNLFLGIDRSASRKLQEALLAARLEHGLTKVRILELYLNVIELGPGVHGVEEAAQYYFGKPARTLSVLEAIHIAALAPAPRLYAKRFASGHIDRAWLNELRYQARRMNIHGLITVQDLREARTAKLHLLPH